MATPLKVKDGSGNIQEFTTSEENYIAYQIGLHLGQADSAEVGSLNKLTGGTSVGAFTNTFFNEPVGTHPSTSITSGSTVTTIYQTNGTAAETDSDTLLSLMWVDSGGQTGFKQMPDVDLNEAVDRYLSTIFTNEYPGSYRLATSSPGVGWAVQQSAFSDTRTDGTNTTYNIYKKTSGTPPTVARPIYAQDSAGGGGMKIKEMDDREIKFSFGQRAKTRIMSSGVGKHQLRSSAQGAPTDPGTWVARGTATDTKQTTSDQNFTRDSTNNFQANYTRNYTNNYVTNYTKLSQVNYTRNYTSNYTNNFQAAYQNEFLTAFVGVPYLLTFVGTYTPNYIKRYTGNYDGAFVGPGYVGNYTGNYTPNYTRRYTGNYDRGYTQAAYLGNFVGNYLRNYTHLLIVEYSGAAYLRNYAGNYVRAGFINYARNYAREFYDRDVSFVLWAQFLGGAGQYFNGYSRGFYTRTFGTIPGTSLGFYAVYYESQAWNKQFAGSWYSGVDQFGTQAVNFWAGFAPWARYIAIHYTGTFFKPASYVNFVRPFDYSRQFQTNVVYTRNQFYTRSVGYSGWSTSYTNSYAGPANQVFVGFFTGGNFISDYIRTFLGYYERDFALDYQSQNYTGNYTRQFQRLTDVSYTAPAVAEVYTTSTYTPNYTRQFQRLTDVAYTAPGVAEYYDQANYTPNYTGNYTSNYIKDYTSQYQNEFAAQYLTDYIGNYENIYTNEFTSQYIKDYIGNFIGNFAGLTIDATDENIETWTLYVRIA